LITCELCGTSNEAKSSVCKKCGASLKVRAKQSLKYSTGTRVIYSSKKPQDSFIDLDDGKDIFSSKTKYEIARKEMVLEKIMEREREMGETGDMPYTIEDVSEKKEPEAVQIVQPVVINRETSSDIVSPKKQFVPRDTGFGTAESRKSSKNNNKKNKQKNKYNTDHNIPQRVIKSVDTQKLAAQQAERERRAETVSLAKTNETKMTLGSQAANSPAEQKTKVIELGSKKNAVQPNDEVKTFERKRKKPAYQDTGAKNYDRPASKHQSRENVVKKSQAFSDKASVSQKTKIITSADIKAADNSQKHKAPQRRQPALADAEQGLLNAVDNSVNEKAFVKQERVKAKPEKESRVIAAKAVNGMAEKTEANPEKTAERAKRSSETAVNGTSEKTEANPEKTEERAKRSSEKAVSGTAEKTEARPEKTEERAKRSSEKAVSGTAEKTEAKPEKTEERAKRSSEKAVSGTQEKTEAKPEKTAERDKRSFEKPVSGTTEKTEVKPEKTAEKDSQAIAAMPVITETEKQAKPAKTSLNSAKSKTNKVSEKTKKKIFDDEDISANKYFASLAYFGILLLVPFLKCKQSKFCRAHAKQGTAVFVYSIIVELISLLAVIGLRALFVWVLVFPYIVYSIAMFVVFCVMCVLLIIPAFTGAKNAFNGKYKTVPIAGRFVKKKSKVQKKIKKKKSSSTKE